MRIIFPTTLILALSLIGCKNYYNDSINWIDSMDVGSSLDSVKSSIPDYFTVDWKNPDTMEYGTLRYQVNWISGNRDILGMSNYLEFEDDRFKLRIPHK